MVFKEASSSDEEVNVKIIKQNDFQELNSEKSNFNKEFQFEGEDGNEIEDVAVEAGDRESRY